MHRLDAPEYSWPLRSTIEGICRRAFDSVSDQRVFVAAQSLQKESDNSVAVRVTVVRIEIHQIIWRMD